VSAQLAVYLAALLDAEIAERAKRRFGQRVSAAARYPTSVA